MYIPVMDALLRKIRERKLANKQALTRELKRIKAQLVKMGAVKIVLFGSFPRGDINSWSDLDLLVIMPPTKSGKQWRGDVYEFVDRKAACDFFVYTPDEFAESLPVNRFLRHALETGKVIYERRS